MADESRMNRFRVGDIVAWEDASVFPPVQYEGEITGFGNDELTYVTVEMRAVGSDKKKDAVEKTLTEDEVRRVA
jgi:hypothetical protein